MIELLNISKSYRDVNIFSNLNLSVRKETPVVLYGSSGSGKTTLLRLVAGLEIPENGTIAVDDIIVSRPGWVLHPSKRGMKVVFQSPALWPHLTVEKNILFGLSDFDKKTAVEMTGRIIEQTALKGLSKRYPHQLSGGQAKRAALARALVCPAEYYLLDEPLSNQDDKNKDVLIDLILERIRELRAGLLYITHDKEEARRISGRMVKITGGKLYE